MPYPTQLIKLPFHSDKRIHEIRASEERKRGISFSPQDFPAPGSIVALEDGLPSEELESLGNLPDTLVVLHSVSFAWSKHRLIPCYRPSSRPIRKFHAALALHPLQSCTRPHAKCRLRSKPTGRFPRAFPTTKITPMEVDLGWYLVGKYQ